MKYENEKRAYVREDCFYSDAKVVFEKGIVKSVVVIDLSASGLKFIVKGEKKHYGGEHALFKLKITEFAAEIEIQADIIIRRVDVGEDGEITYGAAFGDLTLEQQIRLDEIILYGKRRTGKTLMDD